MSDATEVRGGGNGLGNAASAYLRSAVHQPVDWQEWGAEAFATALAEDKPILLDIGAVWCHWCHVMDRESYEDASTAGIINEHFVAIKVDRDERPDVDTRYQAAVAAISGQGGWPLTAFLTPDGKPYFGGTYFPPDDRYGRPSFKRVLLPMAEAFEKRRGEVDESAGSVMGAIEHNESFSGKGGELGPELAGKLVASAVGQFDARHGGFGSQPKFPHPAAIDLLLDAAGRGDAKAKNVAMTTLGAMGRGGIYDHLAGGFHRYSVDERWVVPHFEKMAYDNSELLRNYVHAFQSFGDVECGRIAREVVEWVDAWLSDRERGGFYASQDADFSLEDDGDYFTWTKDEALACLSEREFAVASAYWDVGDIGDMHHNPAKNVLHVEMEMDVVAKRVGVSVEESWALLGAAKKKMYAERLRRETPFVDRTVYVGWNGMFVSAYLDAGRVLGLAGVREFALKTLDRVLREGWDAERGMAHVIAYGDGAAGRERVEGGLDDYVFAATACVDAWECSGEMRYYESAMAIAEFMVREFYDAVGGGFFDTRKVRDGEVRLGVLGARRKPLQDSPTPAGNAAAAALLVRLESLSGREDFRVKAEETLEAFAGIVEHFGLYAATYGLALQRMVCGVEQICVIGDDGVAAELERAALGRYAVNKSVVRLRVVAELPPMLAETIPNLPAVIEGRSCAVVCRGSSCLPAVFDAAGLKAALGS